MAHVSYRPLCGRGEKSVGCLFVFASVAVWPIISAVVTFGEEIWYNGSSLLLVYR